MENQITIREAITENDVAVFWEQLHMNDSPFFYYVNNIINSLIASAAPCFSACIC